jgi:dienelactone hydrolase
VDGLKPESAAASEPRVQEDTALFGAGGRLVGVVSRPARGRPGAPAFLLLNAGGTYRVGPSRLYVRLARALASRGYLALRYDNSVVGDSRLAAAGRDAPSREALEQEPRQAMEWLTASYGARRFVLMGLCSGAMVSLHAAAHASDVAGVGLIGLPPPPGRAGARSMLRHYARLAFRSSFRGKQWRAIAGGHVNFGRVRLTLAHLFSSKAVPQTLGPAVGDDLPQRLAALRERGVAVLLLHAEGDEGLDHTAAVLARARRETGGAPPVGIEVIRGSNHLFTMLSNQEALLARVLAWADELSEPARA